MCPDVSSSSPPTIGLSWTTTSRKRPLTLRILCGLVREVRLYQRERMVRYRGCNPWAFFLIHRLFKHYRCGKTPETCISSEQLWRRCFNRRVARWCHCLLLLEESILILFSLSRGNLTGIRFRTKLSGVFGFVLVYYPLLNWREKWPLFNWFPSIIYRWTRFPCTSTNPTGNTHEDQ